MMKVINTSDSLKIIFGDLSIGDVFLDEKNTVCIKTSTNGYIYFNENQEWMGEVTTSHAEVFPVEADLVIK